MTLFGAKYSSSLTSHQRGAGTVESLMVLMVLCTMLLGTFQGLLAYRAKISLNHAVTEAARTGAVNHAQSAPMIESISEQMSPLYGGWGTGGTEGLIEAIAESTLDIATPIASDGAGLQLHILNPTDEAFTAFGENNANGIFEIPNHHLKHRDRAVDSAAGVNIQDANLLKIHVTYGYKLNVPIVDKIIATAGNTFDPQHSAYYSATPPRLPITSTAVARMHTAARKDDANLSVGDDLGAVTAAVVPPQTEPEPEQQPEPAPESEPAPQPEPESEPVPEQQEQPAPAPPPEPEPQPEPPQEQQPEEIECTTTWDDDRYDTGNPSIWNPFSWPQAIAAAGRTVLDFFQGLYEGARDQLQDLWNLINDPGVLINIAEQFIREPIETLRQLLQGIVDDVERVLQCGPRDIGQVIGQNIDPFVAVRLVSKFADLANSNRLRDYIDNLDPRIRCTVGASFPAGTSVLTAHGLRSIETLRRGDLVATRTGEYSALEYESIAKTHNREAHDIYLLTTSVGQVLVTSEHPFYLHDNGWVAAKDLMRGDVIATLYGTATVYDSRFQSEQARVYNLTVDVGESYFVVADEQGDVGNALWVHNMGRRSCWDADEFDLDAIPSRERPLVLQDGRPVYNLEVDGEIVRVYRGDDGRIYDYDNHPPNVDPSLRPQRAEVSGNQTNVQYADGANEVSGANILNDYGYDVEFQQRDLGGPGSIQKADYDVSGLGQVDEYSPITNSNERIADGIVDKRGQAPNILVQKDLSFEDMANVASRVWGKEGIDRIIFTNSAGDIFIFNRP